MQAFKKFVGCVAPEPTDVSYIEPAALINKSHFITAGVLGEGGFGKVMTGTCTKNSEWYAIKEIDKVCHDCLLFTRPPYISIYRRTC